MKRTFVAVLLLLLPAPVLACSLCGSAASQSTLRQEWQQSAVVLYGTLSNPRFNNNPGAAPGSGTTDLNILDKLKSHPLVGDRKVVQLDRYLPVLDPKDPPKFLVFYAVAKDQLKLLTGRQVQSPAVLKYLADLAQQKPKDRTEELLFFFRYLDHADREVATDAYTEFARSSDADVARVARRLSPDKLRRILQDEKTPPERLGLFAFLLGGCGGDGDAELLRSLIVTPSPRTAGGLDGLLAGYIQLRPKEGWELARAVLADEKRRFEDRYSVVRMVEFQHAALADKSRPDVLRACEIMLNSGQLADFAVEDLRKWQVWDLTPLVLKQYGQKTHDTPIVQRAILRYALSCPRAEARSFLDTVRRRQPALVKELQEGLEFISGK
jgi:hypothetical protein